MVRLVLLVACLSAASAAQASDCGLLERYPHQGQITLSNGASVPVPTQARELDSYVVFAELDLAAAADKLGDSGLHPLVLDGHAVGALSIFDYKDSDLGIFRESYFVILAVRDQAAPARVALYHVKAWSDSVNAALASSELWGIPSQEAKIEIAEGGHGKSFALSSRGFPVFKMNWESMPALRSPWAPAFLVDAIGRTDAGLKSSPIRACGEARVDLFTARDSLVLQDRSLDVLLKALAFKPVAKALLAGEQAVQFLPDP